jgi:hypothetical protein
VGILGVSFFVLITALYDLYWIYCKYEQQRKTAFYGIAFVLAVFFISGWGEYSDQLLAKQTNSWLSSEVAGFVRASIPDSNLEGEELSLFIIESFGNKEKTEIYNGLRVRGFDNMMFCVYDPINITGMATKYGVIVEVCPTGGLRSSSIGSSIEFNNTCYQLRNLGF